jgi:hypothetical protein
MIMEAIGPQTVYSFDHVAMNNNVTSCDMKKVPLADEALDVAVFSLSLQVLSIIKISNSLSGVQQKKTKKKAVGQI